MYRISLLPGPAPALYDTDNLVGQSACEARDVSDAELGFLVRGLDDPVHGDASALTTEEGYGDHEGLAAACGAALGAEPHEWRDAIDGDFYVQGWVQREV